MLNVKRSNWCGSLRPDISKILWSTDSCQNNVSSDQYHMTISRAQVSTCSQAQIQDYFFAMVTTFFFV